MHEIILKFYTLWICFQIVSNKLHNARYYTLFTLKYVNLLLGWWCSGLVSGSCLTLCDPMDCSSQLLCPWDFPGKNTGVGCHFLLHFYLVNVIHFPQILYLPVIYFLFHMSALCLFSPHLLVFVETNVIYYVSCYNTFLKCVILLFEWLP